MVPKPMQKVLLHVCYIFHTLHSRRNDVESHKMTKEKNAHTKKKKKKSPFVLPATKQIMQPVPT